MAVHIQPTANCQLPTYKKRRVSKMSKGKFYAGDFHLGYCAFCKHWYDPTNSAITPLHGNWWEFDRGKEARCMKSVGLKTKGRHSCGKFELKI